MKLFYFFLLLFLPSILFAQSNYNEGFVIKANGDTLKGFINYQEWTISPQFIDFKVNKSDKQALNFTPQAVRGFQITGKEVYISYAGKISMDKNAFPDLPKQLDTTQKTDTIFLRQVTSGKYITLHYNADDVKARYFLSDAGSQPFELSFHEYYSDDQNHYLTTDNYKRQLSVFIYKYDPQNNRLVNKLKFTGFNQGDLEEIVDRLNGGTNTGKKPAPSRFFAGAGIGVTTTDFNGTKTNAISPNLNLGIDLFTNPNVQQVILRGELSFSYITPRVNVPYNGVLGNTTATYYLNQ